MKTSVETIVPVESALEVSSECWEEVEERDWTDP